MSKAEQEYNTRKFRLGLCLMNVYIEKWLSKKQSKSPKKEIRQNFDNANEKLLVLRDENIHLKEKKVKLEEDLKL